MLITEYYTLAETKWMAVNFLPLVIDRPYTYIVKIIRNTINTANFLPKYYGGDKRNMLDILIGCKRSGCMFLVGGRKVDGIFKVLEDLAIPEELKDMFVSIPEEKFRMDISSTEIRRNMGV